MSNDFNDLDNKPVKKDKAIWEVPDDAPKWQHWLAKFINSIPIVLFIFVTYYLINLFGQNPELEGYRNAYMNLVVSTVPYSALAFIGILSLTTWLFPYFNYKQIKNDAPIVRAACFIFWGMVSLGVAIVIASVG